MAKPKSPLLSLGARATIGDSLTFQKRGQDTIAREKPIPKDPKSAAQLARRQTYRDAIDAWRALTADEKEAWRGVCPGLSPYHCFMRTELKKPPPPPPIPIDIGSEAIDRASQTTAAYTFIDKNNPANASGIITSIEIWGLETQLRDLIVGTFYTTNGNTLKCRDSEAIGTIPGQSKQTKAVTIAVEEGDYIGVYLPHERVERDTEGFVGIWASKGSGDYTHPGDETDYNFYAGDAFSLYGTGEG
ncbi:hypothetical protein ES708_33980 [subsurface metagenome]